MKFRFLNLLIVAILFTMGAVVGFGQVTSTGSLSGTVTDPSGAVVANATVVVKSVATNQEFTAQTNDEGNFKIPSLREGAYSATITAPGFKKAEVTGIIVRVNTPSDIKVPLEIGAPTETVVVSGAGGEL